MSAWSRDIVDMFAGLGRRITVSGKMVGDCLNSDIKGFGAHATNGANRLAHTEGQGGDLLGGIPAETDFFAGYRAWNESSEPYTLREGLESGRIKFRDFYRYVESNELPEHISPLSQEGADWAINRAWGRAMAVKRDHLHQEGVEGREFAEALWKWQHDMEREARELGGKLEFPPETRGREPYLGRLYRGDSRSREKIYDEGFLPRSTISGSTFTWTHQDGPGADDWVCTSRDPAVAAEYPGGDGETFVVRDVLNAHDRDADPKGAIEQRVVVDRGPQPDEIGRRYALDRGDGGIPVDKIEGVLIDRRDPDKGIIPNPGFKPYEPTPVRPPREDAGWDNMYEAPS
ncbi:hypothetical protein [Nocardia paucivorans]|uniref:hypothetical protein n=1 Tax=Nocardia paucivorans TaxID=114259 RepID=UPI0005933440|nr:hypothetical protein [Nocardia paucivorans]